MSRGTDEKGRLAATPGTYRDTQSFGSRPNPVLYSSNPATSFSILSRTLLGFRPCSRPSWTATSRRTAIASQTILRHANASLQRPTCEGLQLVQ